MKTYLYPSPSELDDLLQRPASDGAQLTDLVREIFGEVQARGDEALRDYTERFEGYCPEDLEVSAEEIRRAADEVPQSLQEALEQAAGNIRTFHAAQLRDEAVVETAPGVRCWREARPLDRVGLYIPGGTAPLFSTVLMLAIPASLAGCREVVLCTPAGRDGRVAPAILYAAATAGVHRIFRVGGAQAVAAMALGTESVPRADKIFGPGNRYVTAAKLWAQQLGTAIDMPAGPSEVLVLADDTARPAFVAADLLSQAEHGSDSQVILVTWSEALAEAVEQEALRQLERLPRRDIAAQALEHARILVVRDAGEGVAVSNLYAPEHLIVATEDPRALLPQIRHAGSVFLGHYTPESAGDYASGTNHTLPTGGFARIYGGVSVDDYLKKMTVQQITPAGLRGLATTITTMARAEGLEAHARAVEAREGMIE